MNLSSMGQRDKHSDLWRVISDGLRQVFKGPLLSWLSPNISVQLMDAKGGVSFWLGDGQLFKQDATSRKSAHHIAVEVPDSLLLWRFVQVPSLSRVEIKEALSLEARAASPFLPDDLVWGYGLSVQKQRKSVASLCVGSRRQINDYLQSLPGKQHNGSPQLWAMNAEGMPIVLPGPGDSPIHQIVGRWRGVNILLLVLALILSVGIALTPTIQLRFRAVESTLALDKLRENTRDELKKRDALHRLSESIKTLQELTSDSVSALPVLSYMTDLLPDETSLFSISVQGGKVSLYGQTPNAASLMQRLSTEAGLKDVKAPVPAARANGSAKDNFTIDFQLGPMSEASSPIASKGAPVVASVAPAPVAGVKP